MTKRAELHKIIDQLPDSRLNAAEEALNRVLLGQENIPVCDLGTPEDVVSLYQAVTYEDEDKH